MNEGDADAFFYLSLSVCLVPLPVPIVLLLVLSSFVLFSFLPETASVQLGSGKRMPQGRDGGWAAMKRKVATKNGRLPRYGVVVIK